MIKWFDCFVIARSRRSRRRSNPETLDCFVAKALLAMTRTQGFSLLEILMTLSLFSIALLSLQAMQLTALREAKTAYYLRAATEAAETMRLRSKFIPEDDLAAEIEKWNQELQAMLPKAKGIMMDRKKIIVKWGGEIDSNCQETRIGISGCLVAG